MVDNLLHGFNIRRTFKVACQVGHFFRKITSTLRTVDYLSKNAIQL